MTRLLTDAEATARLKRATAEAKKARNLRAWATDHGVDYGMLQDVLNDRRTISPSLARAIGLKKVEGWTE